MSLMRDHRWIAAKRTVYCIVVLVAGVITGCGGSEQIAGDLATPSESEPAISQQISAGRSGKRDRIELLETVADDTMLEPLSDQDDWVGVLILDKGVVTDAGIDSIARLPKLWHLRLRESPITDQGLQQIAQCSSIQILNLPQCDASAAGIAELAELPDLRNIRIGGSKLGASTAKSLSLIKSLRSVHLIGVPVDDQGLRQIVSLPKLQSLYLDDCAVSPSGWDWLLETYPDLHLHVNQRHLDRDHGHHAGHE